VTFSLSVSENKLFVPKVLGVCSGLSLLTADNYFEIKFWKEINTKVKLRKNLLKYSQN
jgi:hypothetical protein